MASPIWEYIQDGDAEAAILDILINETPELDTVPNLTTRTNMIGYTPQKRWIHIIQEGGSFTWPKVSRPRIDVECYADQRSTARDIANICLASIFRAMGTYAGFGLKITAVKLEQGITRVPDKYQETSRYVFSVRLTTVPFGTPLPTPC